MLRDKTAADTFTEFARGCEPGLRRGLTAAFGSEVGREAAADALVYGWQHWKRVQRMANPSGYLFRVGQNKARDMAGRFRWSGRAEVVFEEPWAEPGFGPSWDSLSDRQRTVIGLVHGFAWSLGEVAELLGVSKSSVQSHEQRGLKKLRRDLGVER